MKKVTWESTFRAVRADPKEGECPQSCERDNTGSCRRTFYAWAASHSKSRSNGRKAGTLGTSKPGEYTRGWKCRRGEWDKLSVF